MTIEYHVSDHVQYYQGAANLANNQTDFIVPFYRRLTYGQFKKEFLFQAGLSLGEFLTTDEEYDEFYRTAEKYFAEFDLRRTYEPSADLEPCDDCDPWITSFIITK